MATKRASKGGKKLAKAKPLPQTKTLSRMDKW
jgi:hypothetical protein